MRIQGSNSAALAVAPNSARRTGAGGFTLSETEDAQTQAPVAALRTIGGIDALMALQGLEDSTERRRRAVRSGRAALDILDSLKVSLIGGDLEPATLNRLKVASAELQGESGDAGLDGVLAEIALRVEVEIAKMTPR